MRAGLRVRMGRRGAALLELMIYVGCLAVFVTAIGAAFGSAHRSHHRLKSRAAAADRIERALQAFRADATDATAIRAGVVAPAVMTQFDGSDVRWYLEGDRLMRSTGAGRRAVRQVVAVHVKAFAATPVRSGVWYVSLTLLLPLEGRSMAADTWVRIGPPWRSP